MLVSISFTVNLNCYLLLSDPIATEEAVPAAATSTASGSRKPRKNTTTPASTASRSSASHASAAPSTSTSRGRSRTSMIPSPSPGIDQDAEAGGAEAGRSRKRLRTDDAPEDNTSEVNVPQINWFPGTPVDLKRQDEVTDEELGLVGHRGVFKSVSTVLFLHSVHRLNPLQAVPCQHCEKKSEPCLWDLSNGKVTCTTCHKGRTPCTLAPKTVGGKTAFGPQVTRFLIAFHHDLFQRKDDNQPLDNIARTFVPDHVPRPRDKGKAKARAASEEETNTVEEDLLDEGRKLPSECLHHASSLLLMFHAHSRVRFTSSSGQRR